MRRLWTHEWATDQLGALLHILRTILGWAIDRLPYHPRGVVLPFAA